MMTRFFLFCTSLLLVGNLAYGQSTLDRLTEFFTVPINKRAVARDSSLYPAKAILAPVITYSPEASLGLGVGAKFLFKLPGSGEETRTSNLPVSVQYTVQNKFIIGSSFEIFSNREEWMLSGNFNIQSFPLLYYGIGNNTPLANEEEFDSFQLLFEPILLKQTPIRYLFVGAGLRYNHVTDVKLQPEGLLENSTQEGVNGFTSGGVELALVYDNRDNLLNATKGWYAEITHGFYDQALGSTQQFQLTRFDIRSFIQPFKNLTDVIGIQFKGHFTTGNAPLRELAMLGGEEIMRGYYEGRFVDRHLMTLQTEYRKNIWGRLGAVAFVSVGQVADQLQNFSFDGVKVAGGIGLRFLLDKKENLNIRLDWGFNNESNNYYLNVAEAF
ncbi:MAG: BamA/TamA family outer membrane protein [Bacteroidota bacterium]